MKVFAKGAPHGGATTSARPMDKQKQQQQQRQQQQQQQREDKNESDTKKSSTSGSASSMSKQAAITSAKKKKMMKSKAMSTSNANHEDNHYRPEPREEQSSKDELSSKDQSSSKRSGREKDEEKKKKKKKKERIPLINRVPTASEYDSDDSLERMMKQRSRYSRYMTEYEVNDDNFVDDAGDGGDDDDGPQDDRYNAAIPRLWSNSDDSDPPQWRSWDNDEDAPKTAAAAAKHKGLVANDEDEISAMFRSAKPTTSGKFTDELKKVVSGEGNRRNGSSSRLVVAGSSSKNTETALNLNETDLPLFAKVGKKKKGAGKFKWGEKIENTEGGQVETILDPLTVVSSGADDDDDDADDEDEDDIAQLIRPSSSDTSSLTDPIKREEMLIAARIRASANENENLKQPDVPRVLSLTKKRSHTTTATTEVPALAMLNSNDSTNEPRTGASKGTTASVSSPPAATAEGPTTTTAENREASNRAAAAPGVESVGDKAADEPEKSDSPKKENTAAKNATLDAIRASTSPSSKSGKAPAKPTAQAASGTIETQASDVTPPKAAGDADAAKDEPKKSSRQSFFDMVPLFRSLSGLRGGSKSKSRDGKTATPKSQAATPKPELVESADPDKEKSGPAADKGTTKQKSRRTSDKYIPALEKVQSVYSGAPIPQEGGDEKAATSEDAKVSSNDEGKVFSSSDDKKDHEMPTTSEMKDSPPGDNTAFVASTNNRDDLEQPPPPPQENNAPQDVNTALEVTNQDKQEPAWCNTGKRGLTAAERNLMYGKSLATDSGSESTLDRVTGEKKASMVYKARKAKKAQMMELDEYSYAVSVAEAPDLVQCLKFYSCGAVAHVFGVAISATDCSNPKRHIKATEVLTGRVLSKVAEVDEVEAQRWRDENTLSPKVEVMLKDAQEKPIPADHVDIDLDKGKRQQFQRKKKVSIGEVQKAVKGDEANVVRREQENVEEEGSECGTPDLEIEHQISRVKEVTNMHFSLDDDSEENRRHEAMLRARRMAAQPQRHEIPITSIRIPTKSMETNEESAVEERPDDKENIGGERGDDDDTLPKPVDSALESDSDEKEYGKGNDDGTMETSTGSSHESAGSGSQRPTAPPQKKRLLLSRFLPRLRRNLTK